MDRIPWSFKVIISISCLIVLILLFVFGGDVFKEDVEIDLLSVSQDSEHTIDNFSFEPEELTYDGSGELNFLKGVSLEGYTEKEIEEMVYIRISTGDNLSQKIVEYTADTNEGRVRSRRLLRLINYKGPNIELPNKMPSIAMGIMDNIKEEMLTEDDYKADDGFGNDARNHVQIVTERSMQNSSLIHCTFILENEFSDRVVAKTDTVLSDVPATISLTDTIVYLQAGEYFDSSIYVESAVDSEGISIMEEVYCEGEVNTSLPGEYEVYYELRGQSAILTVVVTK